ncbi:MAG: PIN domain nuclease [Ancrocorticia sp.]|uniref:PIN domain nuclease n=1 Tax=Ancrocorticia sp. TaxID=2593684 RepID=UPI003F9387C7
MVTKWLIDKSAYVRIPLSSDFELWMDRINRGLVAAATVTLLELGFSARSGADWDETILNPPTSLLVPELMTPAAENRVIEVQGLLATEGYHRAVKVPDLIIASIAEIAEYTVLHLDKDFELIAAVTGQATERLVGDF